MLVSGDLTSSVFRHGHTNRPNFITLKGCRQASASMFWVGVVYSQSWVKVRSVVAAAVSRFRQEGLGHSRVLCMLPIVYLAKSR